MQFTTHNLCLKYSFDWEKNKSKKKKCEIWFLHSNSFKLKQENKERVKLSQSINHTSPSKSKRRRKPTTAPRGCRRQFAGASPRRDPPPCARSRSSTMPWTRAGACNLSRRTTESRGPWRRTPWRGGTLWPREGGRRTNRRSWWGAGRAALSRGASSPSERRGRRCRPPSCRTSWVHRRSWRSASAGCRSRRTPTTIPSIRRRWLLRRRRLRFLRWWIWTSTWLVLQNPNPQLALRGRWRRSTNVIQVCLIFIFF